MKERFSGSSIFNDDDIGPINVVTEQIKRTKTKGSLKGNVEICVIFVLPRIYKFICTNWYNTNPYCMNTYKRFVL